MYSTLLLLLLIVETFWELSQPLEICLIHWWFCDPSLCFYFIHVSMCGCVCNPDSCLHLSHGDNNTIAHLRRAVEENMCLLCPAHPTEIVKTGIVINLHKTHTNCCSLPSNNLNILHSCVKWIINQPSGCEISVSDIKRLEILCDFTNGKSSTKVTSVYFIKI